MVVCEVRPQKEYSNRTHITVYGSRICYPVVIGTPTGSLDLVKIIIHSVLSRRNARFVCFDAKHVYLQTPMDWPEYVRIKLSNIPKNSLRNIISRNWSRMDGFTLRFSVDAMAYHSLEKSPITCCLCDFRRRDTTRQPWHLVSGAINGAPSNLSW